MNYVAQFAIQSEITVRTVQSSIHNIGQVPPEKVVNQMGAAAKPEDVCRFEKHARDHLTG
jgi:hypothetical protein